MTHGENDQFHIIEIDLIDEIFMLSANGSIKADRYTVTLINLKTSSTEKLSFHTSYGKGPIPYSHTIHSQLMMYVRAHA